MARERSECVSALSAAMLLLLAGWPGAPAQAEEPASAPKSGTSFLSPDLKAMQDDDFANPGMLWIGEGEKLWQAKSASGKDCASCHDDAAKSMKGVAARYPAVDAEAGKPVNLEQRINFCRTRHMGEQPFAYESGDLLSLTAYVAYQSRGLPMNVETGGAAAPFFERGKALFTMRQGQLNLACSQCHVDLAGRRLRGDIISHGVGVGYPVYRLEWQGLGSLHRRLRSCSFGVRAVQNDYGADDYVNLELYLAGRARGLPIDTPAIRK
jgi:sulfur-oxidizing protein SoxA